MLWFSKKPSPARQRPHDIFQSSRDIALALVSELTDTPFGEVKFAKNYVANCTGGFCDVSATSRNNMTTVDIMGVYDIDRKKYQDDWMLKNQSLDFAIQIHCEAFQNGYNLLAKDKADFIDLYEKSIILIDTLNLVERLELDRVMSFNVIDTQRTPLERDALFKAYSYSWHETAKIALSEKSPDAKWQDFVVTIKNFCNSLDSGFKRFGLREDKIWRECILANNEE